MSLELTVSHSPLVILSFLRYLGKDLTSCCACMKMSGKGRGGGATAFHLSVLLGCLIEDPPVCPVIHIIIKLRRVSLYRRTQGEIFVTCGILASHKSLLALLYPFREE